MKLNATAVESEDQIEAQDKRQRTLFVGPRLLKRTDKPRAGEWPAEALRNPIRTVTLPMPASCQTEVTILVHQGADMLWRSGFSVIRRYNPGEDGSGESIATAYETDRSEEDGQEILGLSITLAAEFASEWIDTNRTEDDTNASVAADAIDQWLDEFDATTATESVFDAEETPERESDAPAEQNDAGGKARDKENTAPTISSVTDEAQQVHDDRKHHALEEQIGRLAIAHARLKADVKRNRKSLAECIRELEEHLLRGPERLPLIDQAAAWKAAEKTAEKAVDAEAVQAIAETEIDAVVQPDEPVATMPPAEVPRDLSQKEGSQVANRAVENEGSEPWRAKKMADLPGLTPKIVEILEGHGVYTLDDWVKLPTLKGVEYTQLKGVTEARFERISAAVMAATT